MWVIAALRVPITHLLLSIATLDTRHVFRGDVWEEYPIPSFHNVDSFKKCFFTRLKKSIGPGFSSEIVLVLGISTRCKAHAPGDTLIWARPSSFSASASRRRTNQSHKKQLCKIRLKQNLSKQMLCFVGLVWVTHRPTYRTNSNEELIEGSCLHIPVFGQKEWSIYFETP